MVGNDVVDLGDAETREGSVHPRFDDRVFAPVERSMLKGSGEPNRLRWMLWAAKEAAYKLAKKLDPQVIFSPSRFVVELDASLRGCVRHGSDIFSVFLCTDGQAVHAIASNEEPDGSRIVSAFVPAGGQDDVSGAARALAARTVAERLQLRPDALSFGRWRRIPVLELPGQAGVDLSLSHHGRFVAFACDLGEAMA